MSQIVDYLLQLSQSLLELQRDGTLCDVVIEARNGTIYAHSAMLGAASDFMRNLFLEQSECVGKMEGGRSRYRLPLGNCSIAAITSILHAIYSYTECTVICDKECLRALVDMGFEVPDNIEMAEVSIGGITSLIDTLQQMSDDGFLCDVTMHSADGLVKAHSSILAAACPLLKDQLRKEHESAARNTVHNQQYSIDLTQFSSRDIGRNILSIYSGIISDCSSEADVESYNQLNAVGLGIASLGLMEVSTENPMTGEGSVDVAGNRELSDTVVKDEEVDESLMEMNVVYVDEVNSEELLECNSSETALVEHEEVIEIRTDRRRMTSRAGAVSKQQLLNGDRRGISLSSGHPAAHEIPGQSLLRSVAGGQTFAASSAAPVTVIDFQKVKAAQMLSHTASPGKHGSLVEAPSGSLQHSGGLTHRRPSESCAQTTVSILNKSSSVTVAQPKVERNMSVLKRARDVPVGASLLAPVHLSHRDASAMTESKDVVAGIRTHKNLQNVSTSTIIIDTVSVLNKISHSEQSGDGMKHNIGAISENPANAPSVSLVKTEALVQDEYLINESKMDTENEEMHTDAALLMSGLSENDLASSQPLSGDLSDMKRTCRKRKLSVPVKNSHPVSKVTERQEEPSEADISDSRPTVAVSCSNVDIDDGVDTNEGSQGGHLNVLVEMIENSTDEISSLDKDAGDSLFRPEDRELTDESVIMLDMLEEVDPKELEAFIDTQNSSSNVCMLCHKEFECIDALLEHVDDNHHCTTCGRYFKHPAGLRKHIQLQHTDKHEKYRSCRICNKRFRLASEYQSHMKSHENEEQEKFNCDNCDETFFSNTALRSHKRMVHSGDAAFVCFICGNKYAYNCNLKNHMSVHSSERPCTCQVCGAGFKQYTNLLKHLRMCHKMCTKCLDVKSCTCTVKNKHVCDICGKGCSGRMQLEVHRRVHTGEKPEVCGDCGLTFQHKSNLIKHMLKHTVGKTFFCNFCSRGFYNNHSLQAHMRIHTGDSPFQCETCGKRFCTKNGLQVHTVLHSDDRPFTCGTCGKSFAQLGNLNKHLAVHTGTRPFKCASCSMTFVDTSALRRHEVQHTRQRNFTCTICSRTFLYLTSLRAHKLTHDDVKAHVCNICGKGFRQKLGYQRHLKVHEKKNNTQQVVLNPGEYLVYLTE